MPLILVSKVHILAKKKNGTPCCPLKPRVFHQTPHFPHPWIPYPGTPAPRFSSGLSVADPDLGLSGVWGGGVFFLVLPAFLPSVISSSFARNKTDTRQLGNYTFDIRKKQNKLY